MNLFKPPRTVMSKAALSQELEMFHRFTTGQSVKWRMLPGRAHNINPYTDQPDPWDENDTMRYRPMLAWIVLCRVTTGLIAWQVLPLLWKYRASNQGFCLWAPIFVVLFLWMSGAFPTGPRTWAPGHDPRKPWNQPRLKSWLIGRCALCRHLGWSLGAGKTTCLHWMHTTCWREREVERAQDAFTRALESL